MPLVRFWRTIIEFCNVSREIFPFEGFETPEYLFWFQNLFSPAPILVFKQETLSESLSACSELSTFVTAGKTRKAFLRLENRRLAAGIW